MIIHQINNNFLQLSGHRQSNLQLSLQLNTLSVTNVRRLKVHYVRYCAKCLNIFTCL